MTSRPWEAGQSTKETEMTALRKQDRTIVMSWLFHVFHGMGESCTPAIAFNAAAIFDHYWTLEGMTQKEAQLYAMAALWIASKFSDEEEYFELEDLARALSKTAYTSEDLLAAEQRIFWKSYGALQMKTVIDIWVERNGREDIELTLFSAECCVALEPNMSSLEAFEMLEKYMLFRKSEGVEHEEEGLKVHWVYRANKEVYFRKINLSEINYD